MKILLPALLAFTVLSTACGQAAPPAPAPAPPPAAAPAASPAPAAAAVPAVEPWTDLHKLHEPMEANGDQMKVLRTAMRANDLAASLKQAELLAASMKDLASIAPGFQGETPDRFRAFSDSATLEGERLRSALAAAGAPGAAADPAALNAQLEAFRATCKSCHDVYKKD